MAAYRGHVEILKELLRHGADARAVNAQGWTAMHAAAANNQRLAVSVLFEAGGDVEAEYHSVVVGGTPLKYAVLSFHIDVTSALLQHGASINHVQVGT